MSLSLTVTALLTTPKPVNQQPNHYNLRCTTSPGTKCKAITVQLGNALGGTFDPGSPVSTIIVPMPSWQTILDHQLPFTITLDYQVNPDGAYQIVGVTPLLLPNSPVLDLAIDVAIIQQDAQEISERADTLLDFITTVQAIQTASLLRQAELTADLGGQLKHLDSVMAPAMDAPAKIKQFR